MLHGKSIVFCFFVAFGGFLFGVSTASPCSCVSNANLMLVFDCSTTLALFQVRRADPALRG